jgi:hypothetical protein
VLRGPVASPITSWVPETDAEKRAVAEQLDRILFHSAFRTSKRCAALLRHVVQATIQGHSALLKERTLGVEVFGRDANYDTNLDPVVRTTAGEIRKRIAQYYHEAGHEAEIRIDLPSGSYLPEFHLPSEMPLANLPAATLEPKKNLRLTYALLIAASCFLIAVTTVEMWKSTPALEVLWGQVLKNPAPVLIVIGEPPHTQTPDLPNPSVSAHILDNDHVALADALSLAHLASFLGQNNKAYSLQSAKETTFTDLQRGPSVLIAGYDNPWTRRATDRLRFHFANGSDPNLFWIEDRKDPSRRDWLVNYAIPYSNLTQDYAIVARFLDPDTAQLTVVTAGIGDNGTAVAGEFLTNRKYAEALAKAAPKNWQSKNLEAVIATQVINGKSGPPRILAVEVW